MTVRVKLECGHTRTLDEPQRRAECWSCETVQAVIATVP